MTDLISRQAALDNAWQVMYKDEWYMTQTEQVVSVNDIEALPTIDPVKHGKWIEQKVTHEDNRRSTIIADWQSAKCSNCGKYHTTPYLYYFNNYNYCPNCGAKMDGGEDEHIH